jgi:hypothetical protein
MAKLICGSLSVLLLGGLTLAGLAQDSSKPAESGTMLLVDSAGKEQKIKAWKFTAGVRRLSWLAAGDKNDETPEKEKVGDKKKTTRKPPAGLAGVGPEALVMRDELKFHFLAGVTTFVPLESIRSIRFDHDKDTMTVCVATGPKEEEDVILKGTTAYKGINKVRLTAEVDKGDAGIAELTYQGGVPGGNIKEIRFPVPKVQPEKPGRPAVVTALDKDTKKSHKVADLLPLYLMPSGREKTLLTLMFRKTLKLDIGKVKKIVAGTTDSDDIVWQVMQKEGEEASLTLLESLPVEGGMAKLLGLVGRVPVGWKLFPLRRISTIQFDGGAEKDKDKE